MATLSQGFGLAQTQSQTLSLSQQNLITIRLTNNTTEEMESEIAKLIETNPFVSVDDGIRMESPSSETDFDKLSGVENIAKKEAQLKSEQFSDSKSSFESADEYSDYSGVKSSSEAFDSSEIPSAAEAPLDHEYEGSDNESYGESGLGESHGDDWGDWREGMTAARKTPSSLMDPDSDFMFERVTPETLQEHLLAQLNVEKFTPVDRAIAISVIDALDPSGYITEDTDSIIDSAQNALAEVLISEAGYSFDDIDIDALLDTIDLPEIDEDDVGVVIKRLQRFDPIGMAARNKTERLLVQLDAGFSSDRWYEKAREALVEYSDLLANKDRRMLSRKLGLKEEQLSGVMTLLGKLSPNAASAYYDHAANYVKPEVIVVKRGDEWFAELNPECFPVIKIDEEAVAKFIKNGTKDDKKRCREWLSEGNMFKTAMQQRQETICAVANAIVSRQAEFFEKGPEFLHPMILEDIAEEIDRNPSTVSRANREKTMLTPFGIKPFKFFFSSKVGDVGEENSQKAVQAKLKRLIDSEDKRKPYSDEKLAQMLGEEGLKVARRTVAKYREGINIPNASQRKSLV